MMCPDFAELVFHHAPGQFGPVALAAEVAEVEVAQAGGHDVLGGFGGGVVGKVAVTAEDALLRLQGRRAQSWSIFTS